jgi:putative salt-induced outer membrane protein YdiY/small nuclear ribonucleoprotein (snRNP)-like protein
MTVCRPPAQKLARAVPLCLPLLLTCPSLHATIVTLENGDQLSGELKQLDKGTLVLQSSVVGEVKIPWSKVRTLKTDDKVRVKLNDGAMVEGKLALSDEQAAVERPASEPSVTVARKDIAALNPPMVDEALKYSGKVDLGGSSTNGNSEDDQLHSNGELIARAPEERYTLRWEINQARSADIKTTANRRLLAQYAHFLDPKNYLFLNAKGERDELADLSLRTSAGGGYGRQFIDTDFTRLSAEVGLNYVNEDYSNSPDRSFPSLSLGFKYEQKFFNQELIFFNNLDLDQSLEDSSDLLLHNRMGVRVPIANGLNLSTQFNLDYDGEPAAGKKATDTALVFSVGYQF